MNSSDHPRAYGYQGQPRYAAHAGPPAGPRPHVPEETLKDGYIQVERKTFLCVLKENDRGRFLRITEEASGKRNAIIIPSTGLHDSQKLLAEMVAASETLPPPAAPPAASQP